MDAGQVPRRGSGQAPRRGSGQAQNVVRIAISLFILIVIAVAVTGWIWAGSHQAPAQMVASRTVLSICVLAGIAGLAALWRRRAQL